MLANILNGQHEGTGKMRQDEGVITWEAFQSELDNPDLRDYFKAVDLSIDEAQFLFTLIDIDESDRLTPDEFVNGCLRLKGGARALDLAVLMREVGLVPGSTRKRAEFQGIRKLNV